jgi:DNA-binding transcriptional MerR regulator
MAKHSPKQASEILEIPASSVRRYRQVYAEQLSTPDKKRRLTQEDMDKLRTIRELTGRYPIEEIKKILDQPPDQFTPETEVFEGEIPHEPQAAMQSIEILENLITNLQDQFTITLDAKDQTIAILQDEINRLRDEVDQAKKPWWKR